MTTKTFKAKDPSDLIAVARGSVQYDPQHEGVTVVLFMNDTHLAVSAAFQPTQSVEDGMGEALLTQVSSRANADKVFIIGFGGADAIFEALVKAGQENGMLINHGAVSRISDAQWMCYCGELVDIEPRLTPQESVGILDQQPKSRAEIVESVSQLEPQPDAVAFAQDLVDVDRRDQEWARMVDDPEQWLAEHGEKARHVNPDTDGGSILLHLTALAHYVNYDAVRAMALSERVPYPGGIGIVRDILLTTPNPATVIEGLRFAVKDVER